MELKEKLELFKIKGFTYNPDDGNFTSHMGNIIKSKTKDGYIILTISTKNNKVQLTAHIYAWYIYYNEIPPNQIDHIDRNRSNNKISNLRIVTNQQNSFNTNAKGYYWDKHAKKYEAKISLNKKTIYLGLYNTEEEARQAYLDAKDKYHIIP